MIIQCILNKIMLNKFISTRDDTIIILFTFEYNTEIKNVSINLVWFIFLFQIDRMNANQLEKMQKFLTKERLHGHVCGGISSSF